MSYPALTAYLGRMHEIRPFMPPFVGTEAEAKALAAYIVGDLNGKEVKEETAAQADPGKVLFENNCSSCHELDAMTAAMQGLDQQQIIKTLRTLDQISDEMKPFAGNDAQAQQLSLFLLSLNQKAAKAEPSPSGLQVFEKHCSSCHEVEELPDKFAGRDRAGILELLGRLGTINEVMPPFGGTPEEKEALAEYIETRVGGKK
jgi:mono/diheme cytochrome c family protein